MVSDSDFRVLLAKVETTMGKIETMEARQNKAKPVNASPLPEWSTSVPPTTCRFCIILSKSNLTDTTVYNDIMALKFKTSHKPYHSKYMNAYTIQTDNCLLWLNTSVKNRIYALETSKARQLCHVCLSIPVSWNKAQTGWRPCVEKKACKQTYHSALHYSRLLLPLYGLLCSHRTKQVAPSHNIPK